MPVVRDAMTGGPTWPDFSGLWTPLEGVAIPRGDRAGRHFIPVRSGSVHFAPPPDNPELQLNVGLKNEGHFRNYTPMRTALARLRRLIVREDGPTAVEYAVMLALIVVVCLTAIKTIGTNAKTTFSNVATSLCSCGSS